MLSGEDLSCYSNQIESVGLRKCPYYHHLTKKRCHNNKHFSELVPHHGRKTAGTWYEEITSQSPNV